MKSLHSVVFFQVKQNRKKLLRLLQTAYFHFNKKQNFLILADSEKTAHYVNEFLWNNPKNGFLPHVITVEPTKEKVVITAKKENLNCANFVFNLCPFPLLWTQPKVIYEYDDQTNFSKQLFSKKKYEAYKEKNYLIEGRS